MPPPGFTKIGNDTVIDRLAEIPFPAVKVLLVLTRRADATRECWPSIDRIGEDTGLCPRAVRRAVRDLVGLKLLTIDKRPGTSTIYRLTPDIGSTHANQVGTSEGSTPLTSDERGTRNKNKKQEQDPSNKKARGKAAVVEIPTKLAGEQFKKAWSRWLSYRRGRGLTCTPATLTGQLKKLARLGPHEAAAEIDNSIDNGWQSVCYKPGGNGHARKNGFPCGPGQRHAGAVARPGVF